MTCEEFKSLPDGTILQVQSTTNNVGIFIPYGGHRWVKAGPIMIMLGLETVRSLAKGKKS